MKLFILATILAISLAKELNKEGVADLEAEASVELLRTSRENKEVLDTAASTYNYVPPSQRPPRPWNPPNNYIPNNPVQNTWNNPQNNYIPPQSNYKPPLNNFNPPPVVPPQSNYNPIAPQNNYQPTVPQNDYQPTVPQNNYQPSVPQNNYQPQNPQNPQNDYVAVIKNEQYIGENGNYKYEYQIGDGTHVGEEGYLINPNTENENVVKKGWYSYVGGDGRVYTVKWWADNTGFHAFGDHLPTPPPVPPAIQAALDQAAKDEANKSTQPTYYPQPTQPPTYYPQPTQPPTYYPSQPQQTYYPNNNYGK